MDYRISQLSAENLDVLVHLYKVVFGNRVTVDFVQRKFDTKYLGHGFYGHLAFYQNEPVAFHGAVPFQMRFGDQIETSAQYGDAMTAPKHTGKGLFTELGQRTDELLRNAGIKFVWGFPNQNSEYGYVHKLAWQSEERMCGFKLYTGARRVGKVLHRLSGGFKKKLLLELEKFKYSGLATGSLSGEGDIVTTLRDKAFYGYKTFGGNFAIQIKGTIFWIKITTSILIGDALASSREAFWQSLQKLAELAGQHQLGEIIIQSSPDTILADWMIGRSDESFDSWMVGYKNFSSKFPLSKLKLTFGDLDTF